MMDVYTILDRPVFWFGILATILLSVVVIHRFARSNPELKHGRIGRDEFDDNAKLERLYRDCSLIERKPATSESQIRNTLHEELWAATERAREAAEAFIAITEGNLTGIPHSDGFQRVRDASRDVSLTRAELMRVHKRVQDYLRRIVPDDLSGADDGSASPTIESERVPPRRSFGPNRPALS
jgi:hypothetical protein